MELSMVTHVTHNDGFSPRVHLPLCDILFELRATVRLVIARGKRYLESVRGSTSNVGDSKDAATLD